ncbi:dihydrolipoamide succinyltransferase [Neisseria meningitidis]|nr:dihydrolipoamide succinyltransferase [Neisseria meningitidis]
MIIDVKVPMLSESVSEGTLLEWKKKVGEAVARDEILIDIETDKVVLEVPSPQAGVLVEIVAQDGETVVADQVLARIDTAATAAAEAPAAALPKQPRPPLLPPRKTTPLCLPPPNWLLRPVLT